MSNTAEHSPVAAALPPADETRKTRLVAAGGILGAIGASSCCVIPLLLFTMGASGAWIGQLTQLSPMKPYFEAATFAMLAYGFWLVYFKPRKACATGDACARPLPNRLVKTVLWFSTVMVLIATFWSWILPVISPYVF